jgi:hypothetical protein
MYSPGKTIRFLFYYIFADWERGYILCFSAVKKQQIFLRIHCFIKSTISYALWLHHSYFDQMG